MDLEIEESAAQPSELLNDLEDLRAINDHLEGLKTDFTKFNGVIPNDPLVLRFKLRALSAMQQTLDFLVERHAINVKELHNLLKPKSKPKKSKLSAALSSLITHVTKSGKTVRKSLPRDHIDNRMKNVSADVLDEINGLAGKIFSIHEEYYKECAEWYQGGKRGVRIKMKIEANDDRKSARAVDSLRAVIEHLEETRACLNSLVKLFKEKKITFKQIYQDVEQFRGFLEAFFKENDSVLALRAINMQMLSSQDMPKDLDILEEMIESTDSRQKT